MYLLPGCERPRTSRLGRVLAILLLLSQPAVQGCAGSADVPGSPQVCSAQWVERVESKIGTGDGQGHGPDPGSDEWRSVVEFKLGVRGSAEVPPRDSEAWCQYIDGLVFNGSR